MSRLKLLSVFYCLISGFAVSSTPSDSPRRFSPPTELDKMLDARPISLPDDKDTAVSEPNTAVFQVQLGALSDMDSAQSRKTVLEQLVGGKIEVVFDPPYYKLRFGKFASKREAEDELLDLSQKNIEGFVVRQ